MPLPALSLGKIAGAIGIKGGAILALSLAVAFMWWRADVISGQRDRAIQDRANEAAAHAVTKASLDNLEQRMAVFIREGQERQEAAAQRLREQQERSAALGEQIARIRAEKPSAGQIERCETPGAVIQAEGL